MLLRIKLPESRKTLIVKMLLIAFSRVLLPPEFIKLPAGGNSNGQLPHTKHNPEKTGRLILRLPSNGTFI